MNKLIKNQGDDRKLHEEPWPAHLGIVIRFEETHVRFEEMTR